MKRAHWPTKPKDNRNDEICVAHNTRTLELRHAQNDVMCTGAGRGCEQKKHNREHE